MLIPYPYATGGHQLLNATFFALHGGAVLLGEARLAEHQRLFERDLLRNDARLQKMSEAMRALAKPDAAEEIAEELIRLARA